MGTCLNSPVDPSSIGSWMLQEEVMIYEVVDRMPEGRPLSKSEVKTCRKFELAKLYTAIECN